MIGAGHIGNMVPDSVERLGSPTSTTAYDLLTISMGVTAADTFFPREKFAENGWSRKLTVEVPLVQPDKWNPVREKLQKTLNFLTGDQWVFRYRENGPSKPTPLLSCKKGLSDLSNTDSVCLFSGGMDSWIGVKKLIADGVSPILVSHAYQKDRSYQDKIYNTFGVALERFAVNANPQKFGGGNDTSMRSRSFNFLAFGAVAAEAINILNSPPNKVPLNIPENGFIALNAPLTNRRIGSHSTRTAHPFYLGLMQQIFDDVGLNIEIQNPFRHMTKGAMLAQHCHSVNDQPTAINTVSCGKWKRMNQQCGKCVPCIIRRSSFHAAGMNDTTSYQKSIPQNFADTDVSKKDDLMSVIQAINSKKKDVLKSGPLPSDLWERNGWLKVHKDGLEEIRSFLVSECVID